MSLCSIKLKQISSHEYVICDEGNIVGSIKRTAVPYCTGRMAIQYEVKEEYRRRGIATEAVKIMCNLIFNEGLMCIEANVKKDNVGSQEVLKRNDFVLISYFEGIDTLRYGKFSIK